MKIPPYWATASYCDDGGGFFRKCFKASAYSYESAENAHLKALERARYICRKVLASESLDRYEYGSSPLREPIEEKIETENRLSVAITRNRSGVLILNTESVMFVDIDYPKKPKPNFWSSLFGGSSDHLSPSEMDRITDSYAARITSWAASNPLRSLRIYQTAAGLRILFTDQLYEPTSPSTSAIFSDFGADPLYARLTRAQECFRARLTPKPWRIGYPALSRVACYPWKNEKQESKVEEWIAGYNQKSSPYRVCKFVKAIGASPSGLIAQVVDMHDRMTNTGSSAPLA